MDYICTLHRYPICVSLHDSVYIQKEPTKDKKYIIPIMSNCNYYSMIVCYTAYGCNDNFDVLDAIFVLDSTSSASEEVFSKMRNFVEEILYQLKIGKRHTSVSAMLVFVSE